MTRTAQRKEARLFGKSRASENTILLAILRKPLPLRSVPPPASVLLAQRGCLIRSIGQFRHAVDAIFVADKFRDVDSHAASHLNDDVASVVDSMSGRCHQFVWHFDGLWNKAAVSTEAVGLPANLMSDSLRVNQGGNHRQIKHVFEIREHRIPAKAEGYAGKLKQGNTRHACLLNRCVGDVNLPVSS